MVSDPRQRSFRAVLVNTLIANITTSFLWYCVTFWMYLETRNVLVTAILGGSYMLGMALFDGTRCHDVGSWLRAADDAMYAAKARGRDQVVVAHEVEQMLQQVGASPRTAG